MARLYTCGFLLFMDNLEFEVNKVFKNNEIGLVTTRLRYLCLILFLFKMIYVTSQERQAKYRATLSLFQFMWSNFVGCCQKNISIIISCC